MAHYGIGDMELRFAKLLWENDPITTKELVKLCEKELNWKKSTVFTVLRRLCGFGMFQNKDCVVTALVSEDEYMSDLSEDIIEKAFRGSLPLLVTSFTRKNKLSEKEKAELLALIEQMPGEREKRKTAKKLETKGQTSNDIGK